MYNNTNVTNKGAIKGIIIIIFLRTPIVLGV